MTPERQFPHSPVPGPQSPVPDSVPLLLDTDIGNNIDDALALTYLLCQPRCELLGITTVTGRPQVRAQLVSAACRALGRDEVPIHCGASKALHGRDMQPEVPQATILPQYPHREQVACDTAVDFLRRTIRSRPGEITLLSIGPLTNVALLFALDAEIPSLLKQHVMMAGVYHTAPAGYGRCETNASADPHATAAALAANTPRIRCYGLDVTTQCRMSAADFQDTFSQGKFKIIADMAEGWFKVRKGRQHVNFHDPLAAAGVFESQLCTYQAGRIEVELRDATLAGQTRFVRDTGEGPHAIAVSVDNEAFFDHFFSTLGVTRTYA